MASVILKSAGAAVGSALLPGFGTYIGGALGAAAGGMVDQSIGLGTTVTGPRLDTLSVQDSRYGAGIPIVYGTARIAGNVIWSTDLIQTTHSSNISGGKGGGFGSSGTTTTYTYSLHCAVGIVAGPIGGITTIWADNTVIYQNGVWTAGLIDSAVIYTGAPGQAPDPFMQSLLGSGNVPAYNGLAYILFENLQLASFGNRLPNLTFQVSPGVTTTNPAWLNTFDAGLSQRSFTIQNGGMPPIALTGSGGEVASVLLGGYNQSGTISTFEIAAYDVTGATPTQLYRLQSASFTTSTVSDCSWALSQDGRFIAMYMQSSATLTNQFVIYDTVNKQFGTVLGLAIPTLTPMKQIAWIDAQHIIIDDTTGSVRGVRVLARSGLNLINLGNWNVWGTGTATTRLPLGYAQFIPMANGVLTIMTDLASPYFSKLYGCALVWNNNSLSIGTPYIIASGLLANSGGGGHANLIQTGSDEWTLCFATFYTLQLLSFAPTATGAMLTRPWQTLTPAIGSSSTSFPLYYGDRLVVVEGGIVANNYAITEVLLNSGSFALGVNSVAVSNCPAHVASFSAFILDTTRFLVLGTGGATWDLFQCGIIERCQGDSSLDVIVGDILNRAGYASGDYDVTALAASSVNGYVLAEPMTARSAIEPLQVYAPFDLVETSGTLKAVLRHGTPDTVITASEWRAALDNNPPPPALDVTRAQELDLPREIDVDYIDPARNFEVNSQRARRSVTAALNVQKINLPLVTDADTAKSVAETRLFALWSERDLVRVMLSRCWLALDPGDVVDLGNGRLLRVSKIQQTGGLLQVEGFTVNAAAYDSIATGDSGLGIARVVTSSTLPSQLYLLDLPLLQGDDDQPGVYAAATGLAGWTGSSLWRAADGVNYSMIASLPNAAIGGIATTALASGSAFYLDKVNSVSVQIINGSLSSCSSIDLLNGVNAALLGSEIIQFQTATLTGPGLYILSNLLRGRRGTESAIGSHVLGENFVLLNSGAVEFIPSLLNDRGATYEFRALSQGQSLGSASDVNFTYSLGTIQPFAPVNITGTRLGGTGTDLTIVWKRRARMNAEWVSFIDVPLDEPVELYDVEIANGATIVRTFFSVTSPTVTYTAAMQSADWATIPTSFTVNIYQISSRYGRGKQAVGVV